MGGEAIHLAHIIVICFSFNKDDSVKVYPPSLREFSSDNELMSRHMIQILTFPGQLYLP